MHDLLKNPKKRRQLIIAGVAIGGVILVLLLKGKSTAAAAGTEPTVNTEGTLPTTPSETGGGGSSSGGSDAGAEEIAQAIIAGQQGQLAQTEAIEKGQQAQTEAFTSFLSSLSSPSGSPTAGGSEEQAKGSNAGAGHGGTPLANAMTVNHEPGNLRNGEHYKSEQVKGGVVHNYPAQHGKPAQKIFVPSTSASRSPSQPVTNTQKGNPRAGDEYKTEKVKGKTEHVYTHSVPHGVGKGHNIVVV